MIQIQGYQHLEELKEKNIIGNELQEYIKNIIWQRYNSENNEEWYNVEKLAEKKNNGTLEVDTEYFKIIFLDIDDDPSDLPSFDGFCGGSILNTIPERVEKIIKDGKTYCHETIANTDDIVDFIIPERNYPDGIKEKLFKMNV